MKSILLDTQTSASVPSDRRKSNFSLKTIMTLKHFNNTYICKMTLKERIKEQAFVTGSHFSLLSPQLLPVGAQKMNKFITAYIDE